MDEFPLRRLDLRAPLHYADAPNIPPFCLFPGKERNDGEEAIFCFELNPEQANRIDPDPDHFLGELVFAGKNSGNENSAAQPLQLPAGQYLFAQQRRTLNRDECIAMAVEQHKDGLWERLKPENRLYIRFLFEDGSAVTQVFRPYVE